MTTLLTYHHIGDPPAGYPKPHLFVSAASFEAQLAALQQWKYESVSLAEAVSRMDKKIKSHSVTFTFDDGFADNVETALPLLQRYNAKGIFFITAGKLGTTDENGRYMTAEQVCKLVDAGMEIGSHTMTHPRLHKLPLDEARRELLESKTLLESITNQPVRYLAYPSGSLNLEVAAITRQTGYAAACSVIRDNRIVPKLRYWLPRVMVMRDTPLRKFKHYFGTLYHWEHALKNRKRWGKYL